MNRLQEIEARLAAIANEIEQRGAELTAEQLTAFETEVNNLKTERAGLMAAAEQRNNLLNSIAEGRSGGAVVRTFPSPSSPAGGEQRDEADPLDSMEAAMNLVREAEAQAAIDRMIACRAGSCSI